MTLGTGCPLCPGDPPIEWLGRLGFQIMISGGYVDIFLESAPRCAGGHLSLSKSVIIE